MSGGTPGSLLPVTRGEEIVRRLGTAFGRRPARVTFQPSGATDFIAYFPEDLDSYVASLSDERTSIAIDRPLAETDILITTAHGGGLEANRLWRERSRGFAGVVAGWFWDNHVSAHKNLFAALACDVVFPSHRYVSPVLSNPVSILAPHVPLCAAQVTPGAAARWFDEAADRPRSDRLYCGYVTYPDDRRNELLDALQTGMPEADVLLMPMADRSRFFGKTRRQRFDEWLGYKTSLVLPHTEDLSTRLFDGLLAGHAIVAPTSIRDLDRVIPPPIRATLGIVLFADWTTDAVRRAHAEALARWDAEGMDGARRRRDFVLQGHMLGHRVRQMVDCLAAIASGKARLTFEVPKQRPPALRVADAW